MEFWGEIGVLGIIISTSVFISKNLISIFTKNLKEDNEDNKKRIAEIEQSWETNLQNLLVELKNLTENLNKTILNFTELDYKRQKDIVKIEGKVEITNKRVATLEREMKDLKNEKRKKCS